jgi:hypothetical protein
VVGVSCVGYQENFMVAEIQKLEAAARMAMGDFECDTGAISVKPQRRFIHPAYPLLALAVVGLAVALL